MGTFRHGTRYGRYIRGCHCDLCMAVRSRRRPIRHGTRYAYEVRGCRCPECRAANTQTCRRYEAAVQLRPELARQHRDVSDPIAVERVVSGDLVATGVNDRRTAAAILTDRGLPARDIARRLGVSVRTVQRYRAVA